VRGEPGIGKTALVSAALTRASALGCRVLRGNGDELMEPFPLRLMADCLGISARSTGPTSARIASLLPSEAGIAGAIDPVIAAAEQMLELVDRLCADGSGADSVARHLLAVPGPIEGTTSSLSGTYDRAMTTAKGLAGTEKENAASINLGGGDGGPGLEDD
jgi:hypothetical protein